MEYSPEEVWITKKYIEVLEEIIRREMFDFTTPPVWAFDRSNRLDKIKNDLKEMENNQC